MTVQILLSLKHKDFRETVRRLLAEDPTIEVVAVTDGGWTLLEILCRVRPDLVLMDLDISVRNSIFAIQRLESEYPGIKVVATSLFAERQIVAAAFRAGAAGYLTKDCFYEDLIETIQVVYRDRYHIGRCTKTVIYGLEGHGELLL